jgi:hypothetical protein
MMQKHHKILNFDNNTYDFYKCLFPFYNKKYPVLDSFENINNILSSNYVSENDKQFYDVNVPEFGVNDRKSFLIRDFHNFIDNDPLFYNLYETFIINVIKPLFPDELFRKHQIFVFIFQIVVILEKEVVISMMI